MNSSAKRIVESAFYELTESTYLGIAGVLCIDSGKDGPCVGVTVNTHANEPSGLIMLQYLLHQFGLREKMLCGKICFVMNNIEATRRYLSAETFEEKRAHRFVDINMNRLPDDWEAAQYADLYEVKRAKELLPVYEMLDVAIDIHSTENKSAPMIIEIQGDASGYFEGMRIEKLIRNIVPVQIGIPIGAIYGNRKTTPVFEIEAGSHEDGKAFECAIESTRIFLENAEILAKELTLDRRRHPYEVYQITSSLIFPTNSFRLNQIFPAFHSMKKGEEIGFGNDAPVLAPFDGNMVLPPAATIPTDFAEEVMFFSKPSILLAI